MQFLLTLHVYRLIAASHIKFKQIIWEDAMIGFFKANSVARKKMKKGIGFSPPHKSYRHAIIKGSCRIFFKKRQFY